MRMSAAGSSGFTLLELIVVIAISTWFGGINAYQALREANAAATSAAPAE